MVQEAELNVARPRLVHPQDVRSALERLDDGRLSQRDVTAIMVARFCVDLDLLADMMAGRARS